MINRMNKIFENVNKKMGVDMEIPKPTKNRLKGASIVCAAAGTGLLVMGISRSFKWCTLLGGISILSSIVQNLESKKR